MAATTIIKISSTFVGYIQCNIIYDYMVIIRIKNKIEIPLWVEKEKETKRKRNKKRRKQKEKIKEGDQTQGSIHVLLFI